MKVLFVLENYFPHIGGVETLFRHLVEKLVAAGHECIVITSRQAPKDPLLEEDDGLKIVRIPVANRYLFTLKALIPIFKHIRSCDLVQTTSYNAALPAFLGSIFFRKKILITFHEAWGKLWFQLPYMSHIGRWGHYLFEQLLLRLPFNRFIAVSQYTAKRLEEEGVSAPRIKLIYNGIDYDDFKMPEATPRIPNSSFTYTFFGRLGISKGIDLLLDAAVIIKNALPESRLQLIVPTVPSAFLARLKKMITKKNLEEFIYMRHHLPFNELKKAVRASDCVVIPSYSEGFCFAAAETAALGIPIVSSHQAALPEVVSGRFVAMKALSAEALADALKKAYRREWQQLPLRRFELKDTVQAYLQVYESLLLH